MKRTAALGAMSVRPIPIIDPDNRNFQFKTKLSFNAGVGLRIFFNRWFAAFLEVRDYAFPDQLDVRTSAGGDANREHPFQHQRT